MKPNVFVIALLFLAPALWAQETPTEIAVAGSILQQREQMEKSLDVAKWAAQADQDNPARDRVVARAKELMETELLAMGDDITRHPEIGFKETRSVGILTGYLQKHGFTVTQGVAGLPTAFVARFQGNGAGPNLGIIVEYDALRGTTGPFHGDQHSTQGPIGLAAAVAIAEYLKSSHVPGNVIVYGTPAEEMMPTVKTIMYKAGVFDGADMIVRSHSTSRTSRPAPGFGSCCMNIDGVTYIYSGAPAHQLTSWDGRNALEAAIHLFNNIDAIRASLRPEARIQGIISEGGSAPNVVPDRAVANFYIRYPDSVYLAQIRGMVDDAARAAALATGTKVKIVEDGTDRDGISLAAFDELSFAYLKRYGATNIQEAPGKPQGYDETGNVSSNIPGLELVSQTSTYPNHTYGMEKDALAEIGHHGEIVDAETMTAVLFDFDQNAGYRAVVKREFDALKQEFAAYQDALDKAYTVPNVPDPK